MKPILIVEDEAVMRESLRDWLADIGYPVEAAEDGEKALETITVKDFGLLILDLRLPGKDGLKVLQEAREKIPELKGIIITAYPSVETAVEAMKNGAVEYLPKPVDLNQLETIIREVLGPVQVEIRPQAPAEEVTLVINDKEVKARKGITVLEAAQSVGIDIPTLCHHEKLAAYGACRLCTVEIIRGQRSRLVASCVYPVEDGLVVKTESGPVIKGRRILLELILARWQIDKVRLDHWPWTGKALLERYSLERTRFKENTTMCILCGLCVRYCAEVKKANVLGFVGRGIKRQIVIYPELAGKVCPNCEGGEMGCRSVCPTGVIPNDFALTGLRFGKKLPLAHPIRVYDQDNTRDVLHVVGDS